MNGQVPTTVRRGHLVLLACVSLAILLAGTWALPLLDRDEPRFARATVEMMQRGDWVVPWFNDGYRFDKPPLTYWLMMGGYALLGIGELGARLHSVLASLAVCLLLYTFGTRMFGHRIGLLAAFAWATSLQVVMHGRMAVADMPMVLAVLLSQWALWELLLRQPTAPYGRWFWILWVSLGVGFLAKGPIALAVPALTLVFLRLFRRRQGLPWRRLQIAPGATLTLAIIGAWGIPALARTGGQFWDVGIGEHIVRRGVQSFNDRPVLPLYYLATVFLSLFPWSAALGNLPASLRRSWGSDDTRFLAAWILGPYLVFSFYTTQLPHYTMPAFPALLLLLFRHAPGDLPASRPARFLWWLVTGVFAALSLGVIAWMAMAPPAGEGAALLAPLLFLAAALLALQATALLVWRADRRCRPPITVGALATTALSAAMITGFAVSVRPAALPLRLQEVVAQMPAGSRLMARGYGEPSLVFYAGAPWDLTGAPASPRLFDGDVPALLLVRASELPLDRLLRSQSLPPADVNAALSRAGLGTALGDLPLQQRVVRGFNFARAAWTEVVVLWRP